MLLNAQYVNYVELYQMYYELLEQNRKRSGFVEGILMQGLFGLMRSRLNA